MVVQKASKPVDTVKAVHSNGDRIISVVFLGLSGSVVIWYLVSSHDSFYAGVFFLFIFVIFLISTFFVFRIRILVNSDSISERYLRTRELRIPPDVVVTRKRSAVIIQGLSTDFEYTIPGFLNHGNQIYHSLKALLESD